MANTDAPFGFKFYRDIAYGSCPNVRHFDITASTNIYRGMPVQIDQTSGHLKALNGTFATDIGTLGDAGAMVGIAAQTQLTTGSVVEDFPVIMAHTAEFVVQIDDGATIGTRLLVQSVLTNDVYWGINNISATHATDGLGSSIADLDGNGSAAEDNYLKVVDWVRDSANEFGDYMRLIVRFHSDLFAAGPAFIHSDR